MRYRILMSVDVDEAGDTQAHQTALKLRGLLKQPFVRMAIEGEGIRLSGDDNDVIVYRPQRAGP